VYSRGWDGRIRTYDSLLNRKVHYHFATSQWAALHGFEPRLSGSKPLVLPLDDKASVPPNGNAPLSLRLQLSALLLCYDGVGAVGLEPTTAPVSGVCSTS
jgi:hypothetical protein